MGILATQEQLDIVETAKNGQDLRIQAFAGSGKTSTLVLVSQELIKPSLYLAYNKAMAEEAKAKFPPHVEVRTTHSLAYAHIGNQYKHKLERPRGRYINVAGTGSEIGKFFKIKDIELSDDKKLSSAAIGLAIKTTVNTFEYSDDVVISEKHIPQSLIEDFKNRKGFIESTFKKTVLRYAKLLWEERTDLSSIVLCTHDTYMKLFQLSNPNLSGYEVLYGDEFQDANACFLDIFCKQTAQKIAVGDTFQAIYQWRGSVNAMEKLKYNQLCLTQSFRFGKQIGDVATQVLRDNKTGQLINEVKGWDRIHSVASDELNFDGTYTILFRTNAALLAEAVSLLSQGFKLNIEVDMKDFVKLLSSALALYSGDTKNVKHEDIVPFNTWNELETEGKANGELTRVVKIIKDGSALRYIKILENHYNTTEPDIILTSCHKAKGREWDIVVLANDFPSPYDSKGRWIGLDLAERNLLYVAVTRAKKALQYNQSVVDMLSWYGEASCDLNVRVKGIVKVDKYNIHKLPAFIDNNIGEHALDAVLRGVDELDMLESFERGEMSSEEAYDMGLIDEMGASVFSGDLYNQGSIGGVIDNHLTYMPTLGKRGK
jgi:superfamily I DNA/RNA helicase